MNNLIIIILILLTILFLKHNTKEGLINTPYNGKSFGDFYSPKKCNSQNNCFPGLYWNNSIYTNVCMPKYRHLIRDRRSLRGYCYRNLYSLKK